MMSGGRSYESLQIRNLMVLAATRRCPGTWALHPWGDQRGSIFICRMIASHFDLQTVRLGALVVARCCVSAYESHPDGSPYDTEQSARRRTCMATLRELLNDWGCFTEEPPTPWRPCASDRQSLSLGEYQLAVSIELGLHDAPCPNGE